MSLKDKKILLAITGSIAAYKTPQLVRLLIKAGAEVQVVMTPASKDFVSPLSLATVSQKSVYSAVQNGEQWNNHVHLGRWADLMLVAPCSANTLAKMSHGFCDTMVLAVYLSAKCPVFIAPAMDEDMWFHPSTQNNMKQLQAFGNRFIDTEHGELASGLIGYGRMAEPANIIAALGEYFTAKRSTNKPKKALVTAGPTYERIDPVRYIGNFSTGKMGIALALALARQGIEVDLVLGPSTEQVNHPLITLHQVESAQDMFDRCKSLFPQVNVAVMAAAVADYRPATTATEKIKKEKTEDLCIKLVKNPDILAYIGSQKQAGQIVVGFALETNNEISNAKKKLLDKNADVVILNSLQDQGAGFGYDTNKVTLIFADGAIKELPLQSKAETAKDIVKHILI